MNRIHSAPTVSGHNALLHDAVRPQWSSEVISWLLGSPLSGQRLEVLDLGAGTGLGTRTIATLGHSVTAVDTNNDMLSVLRKVRGELSHGGVGHITAANGSAESIPLKDESADAITCLQAWHWMDTERATFECDRVLRQDGMMAMGWHTWDRTNEWLNGLAAIIEPDGPPDDQTRSVPREFAGRGIFERKDFAFNYELSVNQLVKLASSWAFVAQRSDQNAILAKICRLGEQLESSDGLVRFPHITAAFRLQLPSKDLVR